ncbi:phosphopantetheine-binding protein, partial [Acetobacter tropicalis]|uniref:phosphopantetheine-binding protein n=1 Tax=Acetobacter tropicalis TaxID=104102 RepID=UPI0039760E88
AVTGVAYVAPRNATEAALLDVFRTVLGRDDIGVEDNFFAAGGDSIMALRVVKLARSIPTLNIKTKDIFKNSTISSLINIHKNSVNVYNANNTAEKQHDTTVFCIHPAFGLCYDFNDLKSSIRNANVVFVESPYFHNENHDNIDSILYLYSNSIKGLLTGVNVFVSWSLGSLIVNHVLSNLIYDNSINIFNIYIDPYFGEKETDVSSDVENLSYDGIYSDVKKYMTKHMIKTDFDYFSYLKKMEKFNNSLIINPPPVPALNETFNIISDDFTWNENIRGKCYLLTNTDHSSVVKDKRAINIIKYIIRRANGVL